MLTLALPASAEAMVPRSWIEIRGIYGGVPEELMADGRRLQDAGVNAVWMGSDSVTPERTALLRAHGVKVFAEFNTLHVASYIQEHPDAAPVGSDGQPCPPPHGWQGVSPTHEGYRRFRMEAFRKLLRTQDIHGVWLDYLHAHASWERADPAMPDTGFDAHTLALFQRDTGLKLPDAPTPEIAALLLGKYREAWVQWRCDVLTDWVREFGEIVDGTRPGTLLGTFHCPWSDTDYDGALRAKLNIDLRAQAKYVDVFSPMPYHVRFGHGDDVEWIARQTRWLATHLGVEGRPGERLRIWPIVQLADWETPVPVEQVCPALESATRRPATGVMVFHWSGLRSQPGKAAEMTRLYLDIRPPS
jgi:hypothetical protein